MARQEIAPREILRRASFLVVFVGTKIKLTRLSINAQNGSQQLDAIFGFEELLEGAVNHADAGQGVFTRDLQ
ncbi:hypothetical protein D3C84_799170 [compost metagenome]